MHDCPYCDQSFPTMADQRKHIRDFHPGLEVNMCPACGLVFTRSGNLATHMRIHTGEKHHICPVCSKKFARSDGLTVHMQTHLAQKPHQCSVCHERFAASSTLHSHMSIHTGDKPHKCTICSASFWRPSTLAEHMWVHAGTMPHVCGICGASYAQLCGLTRHMRGVHPCAHQFNKTLATLMKEPENMFPDRASAYIFMRDFFGGATSSVRLQPCPHCGMNVADLYSHEETCPGRQGPSWR